MDEKKHTRAVHRAGLFWPIILIIVGIIFLLNNLGYIQGDMWGTLIKFWPIILIAIGLDSAYKGEGIVGAVFFVTIGCTFLLANLGYLAIDAWQVIIRMWPVLLIAIGLDILIGRRAAWLSFIGILLVMLILGGGIWYYGIQYDSLYDPGKVISQPLGNLGEVKIDLEPGMGKITIKKGVSNEVLFSGTIPKQIQINHNFEKNGEKGIFRLRSSQDRIFFLKSRDNQWRWNLDISPKPLLDMKIGLGVGSSHIDLSGLKMKALDVSLGIGNAYITLPAEGQFQGKIDGAIGQMVIYLPQGMGLRVNSHTGLGNFRAPAEFMKIGDYYQTKGFDRATNRVDLNVSQGIGIISVQIIP